MQSDTAEKVEEKKRVQQCEKCGSTEISFDLWRFSNLALLPYSLIALLILNLPKTPLPLKCKTCGHRFIGPWTYWP